MKPFPHTKKNQTKQNPQKCFFSLCSEAMPGNQAPPKTRAMKICLKVAEVLFTI